MTPQEPRSRSPEHAKDAPWIEHTLMRVYRGNLLVQVYCDECGVTPEEWLMLQPLDSKALGAEAVMDAADPWRRVVDGRESRRKARRLMP